MRIAIVGAAGQVGRRLLHQFARRRDLDVFGITRNTMSAGPLLAEGFDVRVGSVTDAAHAGNLLAGADVVVNCALEIDRPKRMRARNEALITNLLEYSRSALVIHLSSVAVYGSCVDRAVSTFERPRPDATYGKEKLRLERFAERLARTRRQPLTLLRLGHVYGPGQGISREAFGVINDRSWPLPFDGNLPSNSIHVDHLAEAIPLLVEKRSTEVVLNATDSPQRTWRQLYDLHASASGQVPVDGMPDAESEHWRRVFRRAAAQSVTRRTIAEAWKWATRLPLKSLVEVTAVRQAMEATLLALPGGVERAVDRRYVVFSAGLNLEPAAGMTGTGPSPWFYSDGIEGPGLPEVPESSERTAQEIADLRAWRTQWAGPTWRMPIAEGKGTES